MGSKKIGQPEKNKAPYWLIAYKILKNQLSSMGKQPSFLIVIAIMLLGACSYEPQDIRFGEAECAHCSMIISDPEFAAQMVTDKGRHFSFDAIECMAAYTLEEPYEPAEAKKLWAPEFDDPDNWLLAEEATFLQSDDLPSPMGLHFSAYPSEDMAVSRQEEYGGEVVQWSEVKNIVNREWFDEEYLQ